MNFKYKNTTINYHVSGQGKTIILLHGFLEDMYMWIVIEYELSKTHHFICMDLLGHGESGCVNTIHTMEEQASMVNALLVSLGVSKFTCLGHSMGGYVCLALAEMYPTKIEGLCLLNSTFECDTKARILSRIQAINIANRNYKKLVRQTYRSLFATNSTILDSLAYNMGLKIALNTPVEGYISAQKGMKLRSNKFEILKQLDAKKLIILGEDDTLIPYQSIQKQIEHTDINSEVISGGHMSHIENPQVLIKLIKDFLNVQ